jgi:hypothetical protein
VRVPSCGGSGSGCGRRSVTGGRRLAGWGSLAGRSPASSRPPGLFSPKRLVVASGGKAGDRALVFVLGWTGQD